MTRKQLIDRIDDDYNTVASADLLDQAILKVTGVDPDSIDDGDPYEGMYYGFSTSQLEKILDWLDNKSGQRGTYFTVDLTKEEYYLVRSLINMATDPAWIRSREDARTAKMLLRKFNK